MDGEEGGEKGAKSDSGGISSKTLQGGLKKKKKKLFLLSGDATA